MAVGRAADRRVHDFDDESSPPTTRPFDDEFEFDDEFDDDVRRRVRRRRSTTTTSTTTTSTVPTAPPPGGDPPRPHASRFPPADRPSTTDDRRRRDGPTTTTTMTTDDHDHDDDDDHYPPCRHGRGAATRGLPAHARSSVPRRAAAVGTTALLAASPAAGCSPRSRRHDVDRQRAPARDGRRSRVRPAPDDAETFWVAGTEGVFRTDDGGATFEPLAATRDVRSLSVQSLPTALDAARRRGAPATLQRSVDGGDVDAVATPTAGTPRSPARARRRRRAPRHDTRRVAHRPTAVAPGRRRRCSPAASSATPVRASTGTISWLLANGGGVIRSTDGGATLDAGDRHRHAASPASPSSPDGRLAGASARRRWSSRRRRHDVDRVRSGAAVSRRPAWPLAGGQGDVHLERDAAAPTAVMRLADG